MILAMSLAFSIANAISLFPHFVDTAGDFDDGTPPKFKQLNISTKFWRVSPSFFSDIKNAEMFLDDTLPTSNYSILKDKKRLDDGTEILTYTTSLEADGLNKDKYSILYLVQTPDEPLYVGLYEDDI